MQRAQRHKENLFMTTDSICFESLRIHSIFFLVFARDPVVFFFVFGTLCLFYCCCCFIYTNTLATLAASTTALHTQLWPIACLLCTPSDAATPTPTPPPTATHIWRAVGGGGWEQLLLSVQFHSRAALCIFKMIIRRASLWIPIRCAGCCSGHFPSFPRFPRFFLCFSFFLFFSVFHLRLCASDLCVLGPAWQLGAAHGPFPDRQSPRERRARAARNEQEQTGTRTRTRTRTCMSIGARRERKLKTKT